MSKILVATDDLKIMVHVYPLADPTDPEDTADPVFIAQCMDTGCNWNSFVDENTIHLREADAINDAESHLEADHERVS